MINSRDIYNFYLTGPTLRECADKFNATVYRCQQSIKKHGTIRTRGEANKLKYAKQHKKILNEILVHHKKGLSVKAIHEATGYDRGSIKHALKKGDFKPRNRSEAMYNRMASTTSEQRQELTRKANEAIRAKGFDFFHISAIKQAITKERTLSKVGKGEKLFIDIISKMGFTCVPQKAVGKYNIDILIGDLAVEIHDATLTPHKTARYQKRIEFLLDCGFHVLYVKTFNRPLAVEAAHYAVTLLDSFRQKPPFNRQYRMIWGDGKPIAFGHFDLNHSAFVMTTC